MILYYNTSLCCGGIERQAATCADLLAERGQDVAFLCTTLENSADTFFQQSGHAPIPCYQEDQLPQEALKGIPSLTKALQQDFPQLEGLHLPLALFMQWADYLKPDIVHAWSADHPLQALGACLAGVPRVIVSGQSLAPDKRGGLEGPDPEFNRKLLSLTLREPACRLTANSSAGRASYASWLGLPPGDVALLPNILPSAGKKQDKRSLRARFNLPQDALLVGCAMRFAPVKDPGLWLNTAIDICKREPRAAAVIWGDGPLLEAARDAVRISGMEGRILLPGTIRDADQAIGACDVTLLTSLFEGMPNTVLEAQAAGVPVVTTKAGGAGEAIVEGVTGYEVRQRSAPVLADYVLKVLHDAPWRERAALIGPKHVRKQHSAERALAALYACYGLDHSAR